MNMPEYTDLLAKLYAAYRQHSPKSAASQERARKVLVDGGSHSLRLIQPFPPRIVEAKGTTIIDEDGHNILDFWQGHYANILGHNPPEVTAPLAEAFSGGFGLQTGFTDSLQTELAELLCRQTGAERVRFTTSGTLATMYAMLLARAFTGREMVMKVGGGWHGANLWGLKGVGHKDGFKKVDSGGIPNEVSENVIVTAYNDPQKLEDEFKVNGSCLACFIVEPVIGAGGMMPASKDYLETARRLCDEHGVMLIFDEIISGFRYRAGDVGALYGVRPDLVTLGKIIGGGMPVAAVGGRAEIMELVGRHSANPVKFSGGTYSAHPASMLAAKTLVQYLIDHEGQVYPRLAALGKYTRQQVMAVFDELGVLARFTGGEESGIDSHAINMLVFPRQADHPPLTGPDTVLNPAVVDLTLGNKVLQLAMLLEDVHIIHGLGALTTAHSEADIDRLCAAYRKAIERVESVLDK